MKKQRMLFVASLPTKKGSFDGERNKSGDVLKCFRKQDKYTISVIDYTKNKYLQTIKLIFCCVFIKYNIIFVSKCIIGGTIALKIINKINRFFNKKNRVFFYLIGNGYDGFDESKISFNDIKKCDAVIVESESVIQMMETKNISKNKMFVFPCIKPNYKIDVLEKNYSQNQTLHLIYFSRINPDKGLGDLIDAVIDLNEQNEKPLFVLDIAGGVTHFKYDMDFNEIVLNKCEQHSNYLNYLGLSLTINGINSYLALQKYDLHVFPSRFSQECAPGSIIDMFIAGVPTLSSNFPSAKYILNERNSYLFDFKNPEDLKQKLLFIYNHPKSLENKRFLSHQEYHKYSEDAFVAFLRQIGVL